MEKIVGIGNALVDVLVRLPNDSLLTEMGLPKGGMTLIDEDRQRDLTVRMQPLNPSRATGGSAGNAVLALANLGAHPGFVGRVGPDEFGRFLKENCRAKGIDARLVESKNHTGVANTFITPDGERTFGTCLGAASLTCAEEITLDLFRGYQLLHIEGYLVQSHDLMERICRVAKQNGMRLSIDLASWNVVQGDLPFFRHLVEDYMDIVFANEEESAAFTQGKAPNEALQEIASLCDVAIVKLGSKGAMAMCAGEKAQIPAQRVKVVDTTAAGDFFAGGFLYGLVHGGSLEQCLKCGASLSEQVIQVVGTRLPESTWLALRKCIDECLNIK